MENKVYILGSGASISHSSGIFPDINCIFRKAFEKGITAGQEYGELKKFVKEHFNQDIDTESVVINAEEVYTAIEIGLEFGTDIFVILKNQFIEILKRLFVCMHEDVGKFDISNCYKKLLKTDGFSGDTVITFNWDLVLDELLGRNDFIDSRPTRMPLGYLNHYFNFFYSFTGYSIQAWSSSISPPMTQKTSPFPTEKGCFLKLHGSLDWNVCKNQWCRAFGLIFLAANPLESMYCGECFEKIDSLIIPPALNKSILQTPSIRKLWNFALHAISSVETLVIWGYSLPPTDFYAQWLFREGAKLGKIRKVILINPDIRKTEFISRFKTIFDSAKIALYDSFDAYLSEIAKGNRGESV